MNTSRAATIEASERAITQYARRSYQLEQSAPGMARLLDRATLAEISEGDRLPFDGWPLPERQEQDR